MVLCMAVCNCCFPAVRGVSLWPMSDVWANIQISQNLTIYLHSQPDFTTDPDAVVCATYLYIKTHFENYVHCPATVGVRYITVQRSATTAQALALMEARVYRKSASAMACRALFL